MNTPEYLEEKILLKIESLSPDLIRIIYHYLNGKGKLYCYKKYDLLQKQVKWNDYCYGYPFWNYVKKIIEPMTKPQLLTFITNTLIRYYPSILDRIWYCFRDRENNIFFYGQKLFNLWSEKETDIAFKPEFMHLITLKLKERLIYLIYYYIINNIRIFKIEQEKSNNNNTNYTKLFIIIENTYKLYKSLQYIDEIQNKT
jgi:hypothetical protein